MLAGKKVPNNLMYFYKVANKNNDKTERNREGGDIGLFITLVPKTYDNVFLSVGLITLGTFIEFWLVGSFSWSIQKFLLLIVIKKGKFVN